MATHPPQARRARPATGPRPAPLAAAARIRLGAGLLALLAFAPPLGAQQAPPPAGHWKGAIELPGQKLAFDVDLARTAGGWSGDISIPAQGAADLALAAVTVEGDTVGFEIEGIPGRPTFRGTIAAGGRRIEGTFTQGGQSFPFGMDLFDARRETEAALEGFDAFVEKAMAEWLVPGMAIGVVRDGEVVLAKGYGRRDVANDLPVTPSTLFAIGSATKAFTTFAMGRLVDQGKLEWDRPAIEYLPGLRLHDEYATLHLTPRDMVTHRSGLPRHDLAWYNNPDFDGPTLIERLPAFEPNRELRQTFQYNNMMFLLAGHLVATLTGKSWEESIRELIFEPLGMRSSNFSVETSQKASDFALPYGESADTLRLLRFRNIDNVGPAGSINSSVEDMLKWVGLHLSGGNAAGVELVARTTLDEMHTPQMVLGGLPREPELSPRSYGLGWFIDTYRGHYRVSHGGNIDGFSALVTLFPRDGTGVVVLSNKSGTPLPELATRHLADRLFGLEPRDWHGEALARSKAAREVAKRGEAREKQERVSGTRPAHPLADYAGGFRHAGYGTVTVMLEGERLAMEYNGLRAPLEHWHYEVFNALEDPADPALKGTKIRFRTDLDGRVDALIAAPEPNVEPIVFEREPDPRLSDPAYLARFVGTYELGSQQAVVSLQGTTLVLTLPGQRYELRPEWGDQFRLEGLTGYRVRFTVDRSGKAVEALFKQPNGLFPAKRVE